MTGYGAMGCEKRGYKSVLSFETEHQLNMQPLRIDLLIIEKRDGMRIDNEIAAKQANMSVSEFAAAIG